jgi:AbrB family transcriptional regulator, transcriptional pleiotropic regulator of transition state genes
MARRSTDIRPRPGGASRAGGVIRRVDELGRIVIPVEIRKRFGIHDHDALEISVQGNSVVLSRPHGECVFCGREDGLVEYRQRSICRDCLTRLQHDVVST